jgi:hypothetical protein
MRDMTVDKKRIISSGKTTRERERESLKGGMSIQVARVGERRKSFASITLHALTRLARCCCLCLMGV